MALIFASIVGSLACARARVLDDDVKTASVRVLPANRTLFFVLGVVVIIIEHTRTPDCHMFVRQETQQR